MPTIREAARAFEGLVTSAAEARRVAAVERDAVAAERARLLDAVSDRVAQRLRAAAPDFASLARFDARHHLTLSARRIGRELQAAVEEAQGKLASTEAHRARYETALEEQRRKQQSLRQLALQAREESAGAREKADALDPDFLRVHALVAQSGARTVPDTQLAAPPGLIARLMDSRLRETTSAITALRKARGLDYLSVRDETYLPLLEQARSEAERAEALDKQAEEHGEKAWLVERRLRDLEHAEDAASDRLAKATRGNADPYGAVLSMVPTWLTRLAAAFDAAAALRDPRAATMFERMKSLGLLDGADLAALGHRFVLGQVEGGLVQRGETFAAMEASFGESLAKLRRAERGGAGARFVGIDVAAITSALAANATALDEAVASAEARRSARAADEAAARGTASPLPVGPSTLVWWMLAVAVQSDAASAAEAARAAGAAATALGGLDPLVSAGVAEALARDVPGAAVAASVDVPTPDLPAFEVPEIRVSLSDPAPMSVPDAGSTFTSDFGYGP